MLSLPILSILLTLGLVCSAHPLEKRQSTDSFKIYAYGKDISGLPLFYKNVTASTDSPNTWTAHPSSTGNARVAMSSNTLYLRQGEDSNSVGFTGSSDSARSNTLSDVWSLYGNYVLVTVSGANFYAKPTGTDGLYSLLWSTSAEEMADAVPLVLRTTAPATLSVLK
ncbi:hypothetical protein N7475_001925 [Penicillium sp. IBT 31633x]|nr:hypothetical protein N7475_001925 [Penicillium sp. IBT 31633x]